VGSTQQLNAVVRDANGNVLTRPITWVSDNPGVASVNANTGLVTGVKVGSTTIRSTSEGITGTTQVTVFVPQASRITIEPGFASLDVGQSRTLVATARDLAGNPIQGTNITWRSLNSGVVSVNGSGQVTGVAIGVTTIEATSGQITSRVLVAVLGPNSLLSTALPGGVSVAEVKAGQTIAVPVVLDMSKVSANGDLGSLQFELSFDPAVLSFDNATGVLSGGVSNLASSGRLRFAYAGTSPVGSAQVALVTFNFRVAQGAAVGTQSALTLTYTAAPKSTNFTNYPTPITVGGTVSVTP
jgi:hypothetical protein